MRNRWEPVILFWRWELYNFVDKYGISLGIITVVLHPEPLGSGSETSFVEADPGLYGFI
jgi:hypothetical protein